MSLKNVSYVWFVSMMLYACGVVPESLHEPVSQSPLIFKGTVQSLNSSTVGAKDTNNLMVVKVDEIISSTKAFDHLEGENITVETDQIESFNVNQSKVFITDPWIIGESVAVKNLGDINVKDQAGNVEKIKEKIQVINDQNELKDLKTQLKNAAVVFSGSVVEVKPYAAEIDARRLDRDRESEHDPQWMEAKIQINEALKGMGTNQSEISVLFPGSIDIMWFNVPKFKENDSGTWILTKREQEVMPRASERNMFIIHEKVEFTNDKETIEKIQKILK